jgi:hypothetical protein
MSGVGEIADGLLAADDGAVRVALGQELIRLRAAEPAQALGLAHDASASEVRARFLALVKVYHPNRFARRPADVLKLANEVFLALRRAHQRLGEKPGAGERGPEQGVLAAAPAARAAELSPPSQPRLDVEAALAARRRRVRSQPIRSSLGSAPPPSPTASEAMERARRREEEQRQRFDEAVADVQRGRLPSARAALRALVAESPAARHYRAYLHYVTGRMHEMAGRASEAVVEYDRALGFDPDLEPARQSRQGLAGPPADGAGRFTRWFRK